MNKEIFPGSVTFNPGRVWRTIAGATRAGLVNMLNHPSSPVQYKGSETPLVYLPGTAAIGAAAVSQEL